MPSYGRLGKNLNDYLQDNPVKATTNFSKTTSMDKLKMHSLNLSQENISKIRELFPACVTEARDAATGSVRLVVDFDQLRQELSDEIVEGPQERYRLDWPGKREALSLANTPIAMTLRPCNEESINFEQTKNLFIEGDNLDALKVVQESYLGKIKMIYIDPPYNTGNDFIYSDDFVCGSEEYRIRTGAKDETGNRFILNPESNGRFHSDWLTMMYPRLRIAKSLLSNDGFLAVSISDTEIAGLRMILDEIFGADNLVETFFWKSIFRPSNMSRRTRKNGEYVLLYAKDASRDFEMIERFEDPQGDASLTQNNNQLRTLCFPEGSIKINLKDGVYRSGEYGEVKLIDDLVCECGVNSQPFRIAGRFKWQQAYLDDEIRKGVLLTIKSSSLIPYYRKIYKQTALRPTKIIPDDLVKDVLAANAELASLFGDKIFDYPKPTSLIKYLAKCASWQDGDIFLDFFAGSGTSAHSIMALNAEDGINRSFFMIQLPEKCGASSSATVAGIETIADICKERIRRCGKAIKREVSCHSNWNGDIGFRVFKLDSSNMKDVYYQPDKLIQADLLETVDNIKQGRTGKDLLFQVLLDWGIEITHPIRHEIIYEKSIYFVDDNALVACFESGISEELVKQLAGIQPLRVVFRDNGFVSDSVKINVEQIFRQLSPTTEVKSI
jgi:adenine-specific DNA-methyltransferase